VVGAVSPEAPVVQRRPSHGRHSVRSLPKERRFPLPAPLSREERTLLAYIGCNSRERLRRHETASRLKLTHAD